MLASAAHSTSACLFRTLRHPPPHMFSTRRLFLQQLGLGAGALVLGPSRQSAWAAEAAVLPRTSPEEQGVPSAAIQAFLDGLAANKHEMHSFILARHGNVIA